MRKEEPKKIAGMDPEDVRIAAQDVLRKLREHEAWMVDQGVTPNSKEGPRAFSFAHDAPETREQT